VLWTAEWLCTGGLIVLLSGAVALSLSSVVGPGRGGWLPPVLDTALYGRLWMIPLVTAAIVLPNVLIGPMWRYRVHRWEIRADVVYTQSGWFNREWRLVPVGRIQTVDTKQGWLERPLGLATLRIDTASHAGSSRVEGLPADVATALADELAHRAHELRDDAT
jgi:membrane protein YdbS with pleckstrin-like domain